GGQQTAELFPALVHAAAENGAVRPRKIDMLKDAELVRLFRRETNRLQSGSRNTQHLAGFDLPDVVRVEEIERAGFAGDDPSGFAVGRDHPAEIQRAEAARIANRVELVGGKDYQREGAFDFIESVAQGT